jgi:hypothetical protein
MAWVGNATPRPHLTPGKDPVPIVQEAGWAQGRSGQVRKISPPPVFDPRTVQPVASHYTYWAIPAPTCDTKRSRNMAYTILLLELLGVQHLVDLNIGGRLWSERDIGFSETEPPKSLPELQQTTSLSEWTAAMTCRHEVVLRCRIERQAIYNIRTYYILNRHQGQWAG